MNNEFFNIFTGFLAFGSWMYLARRTPEYSLQIAIACLLLLLGFSGKETLVQIIQAVRISV